MRRMKRLRSFYQDENKFSEHMCAFERGWRRENHDSLPAVFAGVRLICIHLYFASLATIASGFSSINVVDCSGCCRYCVCCCCCCTVDIGGRSGFVNDDVDDVVDDDDDVSFVDNGIDEYSR